MTRDTLVASAQLFVIGVACGSCGSIEPPAGLAAPINVCPDHPCAAYLQSGTTPAACIQAACVVQESTSNLVLIVALPQDSGFAPGRTFAVRYDQLVASPPPATPRALCSPGTCAALPGFAAPQGQYGISPNLEQAPPLGVGWDLGNPMNTGLPVRASYRLMWPASGASAATVDAESLGLPVLPVQATTTSSPFGFPAPAGGQPVIYRTYLQPGTYERILTPDPPFNQAFPPEVKVVSVVEGQTPDVAVRDALDSTQETGQGTTIPTFNLTSDQGPMDGWTAYLRDTTGQTLSNVVALHGTMMPSVVLATNHVASGVDALANAELVIAPTPGSPLPMGVFAPIGNTLPATESYPELAEPLTVTGTVTTTAGSAAPADLIFEASAITEANGFSNTSNFEFVGHASARSDVSGTCSYSIVLPQGRYRASVRPLSTQSEVTVVDSVVVDA